jgi:uncharacterized membrane-anchored protein YhcB (DUF1043 family)
MIFKITPEFDVIEVPGLDEDESTEEEQDDSNTAQVIGAGLTGVAIGAIGGWFGNQLFGKRKRDKMLSELTKKVDMLEREEKQDVGLLAIKAYMVDQMSGEKSKLYGRERKAWNRLLHRIMMIDSKQMKAIRK